MLDPMCVYVCMYIYVCVYIYVYTYIKHITYSSTVGCSIHICIHIFVQKMRFIIRITRSSSQKCHVMLSSSPKFDLSTLK